MKYGLSNFLSPETPSWAFLLLGDFFLKKKKKVFLLWGQCHISEKRSAVTGVGMGWLLVGKSLWGRPGKFWFILEGSGPVLLKFQSVSGALEGLVKSRFWFNQCGVGHGFLHFQWALRSCYCWPMGDTVDLPGSSSGEPQISRAGNTAARASILALFRPLGLAEAQNKPARSTVNTELPVPLEGWSATLAEKQSLCRFSLWPPDPWVGFFFLPLCFQH